MSHGIQPSMPVKGMISGRPRRSCEHARIEGHDAAARTFAEEAENPGFAHGEQGPAAMPKKKRSANQAGRSGTSLKARRNNDGTGNGGADDPLDPEPHDETRQEGAANEESQRRHSRALRPMIEAAMCAFP